MIREGSGATDDDNAARADALKIATEDKAFAVFGGTDVQHVRRDAGAARGPLHLHRLPAPGALRAARPLRRLHDADVVDPGLHPARRVRRQAARRTQGRSTPAPRRALPMTTEDRVFGLL